MEQPAVVWFHGWWGKRCKRVVVIGETPKRYRVRWLDPMPVRDIEIGTISLVPKKAVCFDETESVD